MSALALCGERLVAPAVTDAADRQRLARLAGALIGGSFMIATACALVLPAVVGATATLAAISATLALFWLGALTVASGKGEIIISLAALAAASLALPALAAMSGASSSPLVLLLAAVVIEPLWIARSQSRMKACAAALLAALIMLPIGSTLLNLPAAPATGWLWIPVLAYLTSVAARLAPMTPAHEARPDKIDALRATGGLALKLTTGGEVTDLTGDAHALFGVAPEHLLGSGLFERILVGDRVAYLSAYADVRDGAASARSMAMVRVPADDVTEMRYRLFEFGFVRDEQDGGVLMLARPTPEIENLRAALARAEERRDEMTIARNRLLASLSHELRTPLNAIIGFSDVLLLELFGPFRDARQKQYVSLVRQSGDHLLDLVNSILDVSRLESGAYAIVPEPFSIAEAVEMCAALVEGQASAKLISLETTIEDRDQRIVADRRAVQQMLINLATNAIKFTGKGGAVSINVRRAGEMLRLSVTDNGIGIAARDLPRLGQPFVQLHADGGDRHEGAGLGLSLVKGLVDLHGGAMTIDSMPGEGTTVTIDLPLDGAVEKNTAKRATVTMIGAAGKERDGGFLKTA